MRVDSHEYVFLKDETQDLFIYMTSFEFDKQETMFYYIERIVKRGIKEVAISTKADMQKMFKRITIDKSRYTELTRPKGQFVYSLSSMQAFPRVSIIEIVLLVILVLRGLCYQLFDTRSLTEGFPITCVTIF